MQDMPAADKPRAGDKEIAYALKDCGASVLRVAAGRVLNAELRKPFWSQA